MNSTLRSTLGSGMYGGGVLGLGFGGALYRKTRSLTRGVTHLPSTCRTCPLPQLPRFTTGPGGVGRLYPCGAADTATAAVRTRTCGKKGNNYRQPLHIYLNIYHKGNIDKQTDIWIDRETDRKIDGDIERER